MSNSQSLPFRSFKVMYNIDSRIKCRKLVIHSRSLSSPELSRYSRDVCDDRDVASNGGSRFLLLTLCTDNLPLPQFTLLHFAVQNDIIFRTGTKHVPDTTRLISLCVGWRLYHTTFTDNCNWNLKEKIKTYNHNQHTKDQTKNNEDAFQSGELFE